MLLRKKEEGCSRNELWVKKDHPLGKSVSGQGKKKWSNAGLHQRGALLFGMTERQSLEFRRGEIRLRPTTPAAAGLLGLPRGNQAGVDEKSKTASRGDVLSVLQREGLGPKERGRFCRSRSQNRLK